MTTGDRFQIIQDLMQREDNVLNIKDLCQIAGASRSGYYNWVKSADKRAERERKDREDFELIRQAYEYRGYPKGARSIQMRLLHSPEPVKMNLKKILRLMKKFGLVCPVRKANPYRRMAKALQTNRKVGTY